MNKLKNIISILFILVSSLSFGFELQGIDFNQRIDGEDGGYREFTLVNRYNEKQRYRINVLKGEKEKDASKYIEVYPKIITVDPQDKAIFKVFAKAPSGLDKGLYTFQLQFLPIGVPKLAKAKDKMVSGVSSVDIAPVIEMSGYVGEINFQEKLRLENIDFQKNQHKNGGKLSGILYNDSYTPIEIGLIAYGKGDYYYGSKYVATLGQNSKYKFSIDINGINSLEDLKKIVLYRSVDGELKVLKTSEIINS